MRNIVLMLMTRAIPQQTPEHVTPRIGILPSVPCID
jgi:hypothetical protein